VGTLQLTQYPMPLQAPAAQSAPFQFSPSAPNDGEECPVGIEQLWAAHARNVYCSESKKSGMRDDLCKFFCCCSSTFAPRSSARHLPAICPWRRDRAPPRPGAARYRGPVEAPGSAGRPVIVGRGAAVKRAEAYSAGAAMQWARHCCVGVGPGACFGMPA